MKEPFVAVWTLTYNHEKYISQAIESVIMQKTNFHFTLFIGEDCSTDNTRKICIKYANKFPNKIKLFLNEKNDIKKNAKTIYDACSSSGAKYIAMLEGDDYWTDPYKLQKQVDFLEANQDYSLCCHQCKILDQDTGKFLQPIKRRRLFKSNNFSFTNKELVGWGTQPLTMLIRRSNFDNGLQQKYKYCRDEHLYYHLLKEGKGYFINQEMGVYRHHGQGIHSKMPIIEKREIKYKIYKEIYIMNRDSFSLPKYFMSCMSLFRTLGLKHNKSMALKRLFEGLKLLLSFKNFCIIIRFSFLYMTFYLINFSYIKKRDVKKRKWFRSQDQR